MGTLRVRERDVSSPELLCTQWASHQLILEPRVRSDDTCVASTTGPQLAVLGRPELCSEPYTPRGAQKMISPVSAVLLGGGWPWQGQLNLS